MDINISVTSEEMNEMGFDKDDLASHISEALDSCNKELSGFYINVEVD
jgi:hypothetical protein